MTSERDLPLLMWFAVAALLCLSTVVLPVVAPELSSVMEAIRDFGGQVGAATTGMQPSQIVQAVVAGTIVVAGRAQRVGERF